MNLKKIFFLCAIVVLIFTLASCDSNSSGDVVNTPTAIPVLPTSTSLPTEISSSTSLPTLALVVLPSPTPIPAFPLDISVIYSLDGNLYVQDNNNLPKQLTNSGKEDIRPRFSEDGQKIIFSRREFGDYQGTGELYSINVDGSQEQALITKTWLDSLGTEIIGLLSSAYIPGTHKFLFDTSICLEKQEHKNCTIALYLLDTDTGEIIEFMKPRQVSNLLYYFYTISPNGKMVLVASTGHIDIYNITGDIIYPSIMNYMISTPDELVPMLNWLPDSSGLVAALPKNIHVGWAYPFDFDYEVWSYKLGEQAARIPLDGQQPISVSQCGDSASLSPDGTLLFYSRDPEVYIGHLRDGHTQLVGTGCSSVGYWSPDSRYFIYEDKNLAYFIGSVDGSLPIPISKPDFIGWIDANHYAYRSLSSDLKERNKILIGEINGESVLTYETEIFLPENMGTYYDFVLIQK
jgi:hypothetical protein